MTSLIMEDQMHEVTKVAVSWWGERLQQGNREGFEAKLAELLEAEMGSQLWDAAQSGGQARITVEVDYDPDEKLLASLKAAGIECRGFMFSADGILPRKTRMHIEPSIVEACEGYGAPYVTIWKRA